MHQNFDIRRSDFSTRFQYSTYSGNSNCGWGRLFFLEDFSGQDALIGYQSKSYNHIWPRFSPEMPIDLPITKYFFHFALLCLWKVILPVKDRPIWPDSSQPHQIRKWSITFHRHGRAKWKKYLVIGRSIGISGENRGHI